MHIVEDAYESAMVERASVESTPLQGLLVLRRQPSIDHRGSLDRLFDIDEVCSLLPGVSVAQVNRALTAQSGTVRGLHYQVPPFGDAKLVTCLAGTVFDVAVDVRRGSATFLRWFGIQLDGTKATSLLIPPGFAHGYQTLADNCEMLYVHGGCYNPEAEKGLQPNDPRIGISWPEPIVVMSDRDRKQPVLAGSWRGVVF